MPVVAFTYTGALTTDLEKVRFEIGDTDSTAPLFQDAEITHKLDERAGNVMLAAADLCGVLARRFARAYDFATDGQQFRRSQMSQQYAALEKELRGRAGGGISVATVTRVDGYSDDLSSRDGAGQSSSTRGRVRAGYFNPDLPY